ncbi:MAG: hypothetical protein K8F91_04715, partial [Candidatus Obscuribacterales bacterium]|nr:hypothetical protein [Candidatus Obscuribacterales bacterium]
EAGGDQPGMVKEGSKSIWGSIKDGFTSSVSAVKDFGTAAFDETIDFCTNPIDTVGDWYDELFASEEEEFQKDIAQETDVSAKIAKTEERAAVITQDVFKDGKVLSPEEADAELASRLPEGTTLESVRQMLDEPWANENAIFDYDDAAGVMIDIDSESGMTRIEDLDGSVSLRLKDGTVIERDPKGNEIWKFENDAISKSASGEFKQSVGKDSLVKLDAAEQHTEDKKRLEEEYGLNPVNKKSIDKVELTREGADAVIEKKLPSGTSLEAVKQMLDEPWMNENAEFSFESDVMIDNDPKSGMTRIENFDGSVSLSLSDGTVIERDPQGNEIWKFKDEGSISVSEDGSIEQTLSRMEVSMSRTDSQQEAETKLDQGDLADGGVAEISDWKSISDSDAEQQIDGNLPEGIDRELVNKALDTPFFGSDMADFKYDPETGKWFDYDNATGVGRLEGGDGTVTVSVPNEDGTVTTVTRKSDGSEVWRFEKSGTSLAKTADGQFTSDSIDTKVPGAGQGQKLALTPEEQEELNKVVNDALEDGTVVEDMDQVLKQQVENYDQARKFLDSPFVDGVVSKYDGETRSWIDYQKDSGMTRVQNSDGTVTLTMKDGTVARVAPDGTETWMTKDGIVQKSSDGTVKAVLDDSHGRISNRARDIVAGLEVDETQGGFDAVDGQAKPRTEIFLGIKLKEMGLSKAKIDKYSDQSQTPRETLPDGKMRKGPNGNEFDEIKLPNGEMIRREFGADGSVWMTLPDGTKFVKASNGSTSYTKTTPDGKTALWDARFSPSGLENSYRDHENGTIGAMSGDGEVRHREGDCHENVFNEINKPGFRDKYGPGVIEFDDKGNKITVLWDADGKPTGVLTVDVNGQATVTEIKPDGSPGDVRNAGDVLETKIESDGSIVYTAPDGRRYVQKKTGDNTHNLEFGTNTGIVLRATVDGNNPSNSMFTRVGKDGVEHSIKRNENGDWEGEAFDGSKIGWGHNGSWVSRDMNRDAYGNITNNSTGTVYRPNGDIIGSDGSTIYDSSSNSWGGGNAYSYGPSPERLAREAEIQNTTAAAMGQFGSVIAAIAAGNLSAEGIVLAGIGNLSALGAADFGVSSAISFGYGVLNNIGQLKATRADIGRTMGDATAV